MTKAIAWDSAAERHAQTLGLCRHLGVSANLPLGACDEPGALRNHVVRQDFKGGRGEAFAADADAQIRHGSVQGVLSRTRPDPWKQGEKR